MRSLNLQRPDVHSFYSLLVSASVPTCAFGFTSPPPPNSQLSMNDGTVLMLGYWEEERDRISEGVGALEPGDVFIMGLDV